MPVTIFVGGAAGGEKGGGKWEKRGQKGREDGGKRGEKGVEKGGERRERRGKDGDKSGKAGPFPLPISLFPSIPLLFPPSSPRLRKEGRQFEY